MFSGRTIKFILNTLLHMYQTNPNNIEEGIMRVIQDIYCYSYKKDQKQFKETIINIFLKDPENELMQFLRNEEVEINEKYEQINKDLKTIENNQNIHFDFNQFIILSFSYLYKDINYFIKKIDECLCTLDIENIN